LRLAPDWHAGCNAEPQIAPLGATEAIMKAAKSRGRNARAEVRRLAQLVERAVDDGADSVEEVHRSIASMPLDVLERLDLFKETVKDVRRIQDTSIGAIYDLIHKVNREAAKLASELLRRRPAPKAAPRTAVPRRPAKARAASAHAS
jgi:hypothetical protein